MSPESSSPLRIDYVEIAVSDLAVAKKFYGEVFGWQFKDSGPDYAEFFDGRLRGALTHVTDESSSPGVGPLVIMYSPELEALATKIEDAGGEITREIFSFPGGRRFHFVDPSGNLLGVWSDR
jgi:predicted enzyme related to lactoylglutathione lyase